MKFTAWLTILLLAFPLLFKAWAVVDYCVQYEYYVNVLCENRDNPMKGCNGQCALKKELKKAEQKKSDAQVPMEWVSNYCISVFDISPSLVLKLGSICDKETVFVIEDLHVVNSYVGVIDHPPC